MLMITRVPLSTMIRPPVHIRFVAAAAGAALRPPGSARRPHPWPGNLDTGKLCPAKTSWWLGTAPDSSAPALERHSPFHRTVRRSRTPMPSDGQQRVLGAALSHHESCALISMPLESPAGTENTITCNMVANILRRCGARLSSHVRSALQCNRHSRVTVDALKPGAPVQVRRSIHELNAEA